MMKLFSFVCSLLIKTKETDIIDVCIGCAAIHEWSTYVTEGANLHKNREIFTPAE